MHLLVLFNAASFPMNIVGLPATHGVAVAGMHGIGVKAPIFAAVAAATTGFAIELHRPNDAMLIIGLWSMIVAAGWLRAIVLCLGKTLRVDGAVPIEHIRVAVMTV